MHAAQYSAAQSTDVGHQLLPGGFPQYVHNPPAAVQVKSTVQKQPAGEYAFIGSFILLVVFLYVSCKNHLFFIKVDGVIIEFGKLE